MRTLKPLTTAAVLAAVALAAVPAAAAPSNDRRDDAVTIRALPARLTGTTVGATTSDGEQGSPCASIGASVWYRVNARSTRRVVVRFAAGGDLDATVDVYERLRSQQTFLSCDPSDTHGRAAVSFNAQRGHSYLVRIGRRAGSAQGPFALRLATVAGPRLPGPPLPLTGVSGRLDRVARTAQPWSVPLRAGVRYRIGVVHKGAGCLITSLYRPRTSPASPAGPTAVVGCDGYLLFTPRAKQGGRYSVLVRADPQARGAQRYHLQIAPAGRDDSAPGIFVRNYARVTGALDGAGVDDVDLYRFDVTRRSVLFAHLQAAATRQFDLVLLDSQGKRLSCACNGRGSAALHRGLRRGRFFIAVRARAGSAGAYRLLRASRTITKTNLRPSSSAIGPGDATQLTVTTQPAVTGPVTIDIEQFDPLARWQFVRALHARAVNGVATLAYTPPTVGRWRAKATFDGTQSSAPSATAGFVPILVAAPLHD